MFNYFNKALFMLILYAAVIPPIFIIVFIIRIIIEIILCFSNGNSDY